MAFDKNPPASAHSRRTPDEALLRGVLKHRSNKVIASLKNSQRGYYWERVDDSRTDFDTVFEFLKTLIEIDKIKLG